MEKYALIAFIYQTAFLDFSEKSAKSASLSSVVLVVVDIGFVGRRLGDWLVVLAVEYLMEVKSSGFWVIWGVSRFSGLLGM